MRRIGMPGFMTSLEAIEFITGKINKSNDEDVKNYYYRKLLDMAKNNNIAHEKHGRMWLFPVDFVHKFAEEQKEVFNNISCNINVSTDSTKQSTKLDILINLIKTHEQAGISPTKTLDTIKEFLNII